MAELKNRQWLLAARPQGLIKESDFRWNETTVPTLKDGEVLVRNLAFSFDPTQRGWMSMDTYMPKIPIGNVMLAGTVGQIVESKKSGLAKGDTEPLRLWLKENIWRHGKRFTRDELLERATGRALEAGPYLRYLDGKYGKAA